MDSTPNNSRYELRSRTPNTPNTPATPKERILRSASTPITGPKQKEKLLKSSNTPCTPTNRVLRSSGTPCSPVQGLFQSSSTPQSETKAAFRTPMSFKPRLVGNRPVPSPSRQEIWKQQLGLTDDPSNGSDKENSSSEDEENQISPEQCRFCGNVRPAKKLLVFPGRVTDEGQTSVVEYRALQKLLKEKSAQRDETLLKVKNCKDKIRQYKTRLEREETTKKQQLKIMRKTHEVQIQEKEKLINNLQSLLDEQEEIIKDLEDGKNASRHENHTTESTAASKLVEEIKRLQSEKSSMMQKLSECQLEVSASQDEMKRLQEVAHQVECGKLVSSHDQSLKRERTDTPTVSMLCSTDTEKQVEVLLAENDRLRSELTESKNACTKATTVSKLNIHRQQQCEEEVKKLKVKIGELEGELISTRDKSVRYDELEEKMNTLKSETLQSDGKIRDLQAELVSLYAKSPEVVRVTKVKQVESESLKKQFQDSQEEITQLKNTIKTQKEEIHNTQIEVKYLKKILQKTESEKEESEASLWKDMETLVNEHQVALNKTREQLQAEKEQIMRQLEDQLKKDTSAEKEAALDELRSSLQSKFQQDIKQVEEDLNIAKQAAVTKTREEMNKEKTESLRQLQEDLESSYEILVKELQEKLTLEKEQAVEEARAEARERLHDLENRYAGIVERLQAIGPVLSEFVESYILLQREVKTIPKIIKQTVTKVKKEMTAAITGISDYNKNLVQKYQKEMKLRKKYHNELVELKGNIRVFCRLRPVIKEDGQGQQAEHIVQLDPDDDGILSINSKGRTQVFEVDKVFGEESSQKQVFDEVKALVTSCIDGYNVCIFAYGQTGSGKTYTMEGTKLDPGINQRALAELFAETGSRNVDWNYSITVSVIEIYNEMIRDLLSEDTSYKMEVKMNPEGGGLHIPGLSYVNVDSVEHVNECFALGQRNRATAATNMNEHSSRSHALLCVTVEGVNKTTNVKTLGKLNLVDLAGSERVSRSKADGARLKEAQNINKSLSCLGDVIHALRSKQNYVPYRNSKLTYLLQDSLGGDSKTLMITQVAPVRKNEGETICSLNFAQRVRNVELGAATRRFENGDILEADTLSPARSTPQRPAGLKPGTPSSNSKLTPIRQTQRKK